MVYSIDDIKHLELMAELNKVDVAKEHKSDVKIPMENKDTSLTGSILTLCNKLRKEGFDKYADALEDRFVIYKASGVHLYRAHDEDGEDLVHEAHPEGDVNMGEASDKNGDVETIVSKHKKIVDIIQKTPTGKLANYVEQCKVILAELTDEKPSKVASGVVPLE